MRRINGKYYDNNRRFYQQNEIRELCKDIYQTLISKDIHAVICKKTVDTNQGKGVKKYTISSLEDLIKLFEENASEKNFILQEAIVQALFFSRYNPSSVNIMRLTTWKHGNEVEVFAPCLRFGVEGFVTDVAYVDGEEIVNGIGIAPDGQIMKKGISMNGDRFSFDFDDRAVPQWDNVIKTVKEGHRYLEYFAIVAWDMIVDKNGQVICIEYNLNSPGSIVYQMCHGPFAGDWTDELLSFLKDKQNQERYLPKMIRTKK